MFKHIYSIDKNADENDLDCQQVHCRFGKIELEKACMAEVKHNRRCGFGPRSNEDFGPSISEMLDFLGEKRISENKYEQLNDIIYAG